MRLGIDLDGVVADFDGGWIAHYTAEFGVDPRPEQVGWDLLHRQTHFTDMSAFWDWVHHRNLFRRLEPIPGALDGLDKLASAGHEIVIISAKPARAVPDTLHWIAEHRLPTREIHFRGDKHAVACDAYLDDSPVALPALVAHRSAALVCRMVAPWNAPVPGAVDVTDWSGFVAVVAGQVQ
jgi:5'(3')-deoxyribonucleotidase